MSKKITHEQARQHLENKIKDGNILTVLEYIKQQEELEYGLDKEKELYLLQIETEYHSHNYIENYDKRTLNLTFQTPENERLILKLSKGDLIELENHYNEVMESEEL